MRENHILNSDVLQRGNRILELHTTRRLKETKINARLRIIGKEITTLKLIFCAIFFILLLFLHVTTRSRINVKFIATAI